MSPSMERSSRSEACSDKPMEVYEISLLTKLIMSLSEGLNKPFPYTDCRKVLQDQFEATPKLEKRYHDLIPDLSTYFSDIYSHASGVNYILDWPSNRMVESQNFLKRSFFEAYPKYKSVEWRINQLNTPVLYQEIGVSNQLRSLLRELLSQLLAQRYQANVSRQKHLLSVR